MSIGMKTWISLVVGLSTLVSLQLLPPRAFEGGVNDEPEELRTLAELRREVRQTHDAIQALRWRDSLAALAFDIADDGMVVAGASHLVRDEILTIIRRRTRKELDGLDVEPSTVVGVIIQPSDFASSRGIGRGARLETMTLMGRTPKGSYCLRVVVASDRVSPNHPAFRLRYREDRSIASNTLYACRLVAQYGAPGTEVRNWLRRGAVDFAGELVEDKASLNAAIAYRTRLPLLLSGIRRASLPRLSIEAEQCLAGMERACGEIFLDPEGTASVFRNRNVMRESLPFIRATRFTYGSPFGSYDDFLIQDLQRQFGPERFRRFWTSELPVDQAFEAAFSTSPGAWTKAWALEHIGAEAAGPGLAESTALGAFLLLVSCGALVGLVSRRRTVA